MRNSLRITTILIVVVVGVIGIIGAYFTFDKDARCNLIYGKNICNFYAVMDIATGNPAMADFDKMMSLCHGMGNVPKKDGCFEFVAETFASIDTEKAKEACDEIKEIEDQSGNKVHRKQDCYNEIEGM